MENRYQLIRRLESSAEFLPLLNKGILPLSILDRKVYYEHFLNDLKTSTSKTESIRNTSEEFDKCEKTVERAIKFMEE